MTGRLPVWCTDELNPAHEVHLPPSPALDLGDRRGGDDLTATPRRPANRSQPPHRKEPPHEQLRRPRLPAPARPGQAPRRCRPDCHRRVPLHLGTDADRPRAADDVSRRETAARPRRGRGPAAARARDPRAGQPVAQARQPGSAGRRPAHRPGGGDLREPGGEPNLLAIGAGDGPRRGGAHLRHPALGHCSASDAAACPAAPAPDLRPPLPRSRRRTPAGRVPGLVPGSPARQGASTGAR